MEQSRAWAGTRAIGLEDYSYHVDKIRKRQPIAYSKHFVVKSLTNAELRVPGALDYFLPRALIIQLREIVEGSQPIDFNDYRSAFSGILFNIAHHVGYDPKDIHW